MSSFRKALLLLVFCLPATSLAGIGAEDVPGNALWYAHADLQAIRTSKSGHELYQWLQSEVFADLKEDLGIDLDKEVNAVTAFSDAALGTVIVVDGPLSKDTRDRILALAASRAEFDVQDHDGKTYYHVRDDGASGEHGSAEHGSGENSSDEHGPGEHSSGKNNLSIDLDESAYFSFDVKNKLIVASNRKQMEELLDSGGKLAGNQGHDGSLFVLTADKEFVQAGMRTAALSDDDGDWDSNILRNTEKAALLVADQNGLIAVEAELVSKDPAIARSLAGIVNGLIGLQALNTDLDPGIQDVIRNTKIEVEGKILSIETVFNPKVIIGMLDDSDAEAHRGE